jgi:hypothetical protein
VRLEHRPADQIFAGVAQQGNVGGVDVHDDQFRRYDRRRGGQLLEQLAVGHRTVLIRR